MEPFLFSTEHLTLVMTGREAILVGTAPLQWIEKERMVDGTLSVFHGASDLGDDRERSNFGGDSTTSNKDN
jgi:hypothetical protein